MVVTTTLFLWVNGVIIALLLAFLGLLLRQHSDIAPISLLAKRIQAKAIDRWLEERGLGSNISEQQMPSSTEHHSLPPEKAIRRDQLVNMGKIRGLNTIEANELQALLQEDARSDFTNGILNALAFAVLMLAIGAIIKGLSQK